MTRAVHGRRHPVRTPRLWRVTSPPVTETLIATFPDLRIERFTPSPEIRLCHALAATQRLNGRWLVLVNGQASVRRQRFGIAHEVKHIIDHSAEPILYGPDTWELHEQICDYFAGCLLVPSRWLRAAWRSGVHDASKLGRLFGVPRRAIKLRLLQVGLIEPRSHYLAKEV